MVPNTTATSDFSVEAMIVARVARYEQMTGNFWRRRRRQKIVCSLAATCHPLVLQRMPPMQYHFLVYPDMP